MMLLVALTGGFGLLASFSMARAGLDSMAVRYPLALAVAYLFFVYLLWLWLRTKADDYLDFLDPAGLAPPGGPREPPVDFASGGGGDFGGGGASASFDAPAICPGDTAEGSMKAVGEAAASVGEADELAIPIFAIVLAAGLALASLYVVYIAPVIFAELLVDGALSYALLRRLRSDDRPLWLASAVRRTAIPFAVTAVFLSAVGAGLSAYAPGATSIGQVLEHSTLQGGGR